MIRAAAKNHGFVNVVVDVEDYSALLEEMSGNDGSTSLAFRKALAQRAYARTGAYDAAVSTWMAEAIGAEHPRRRAVAGTLVQEMRYGENPHQGAAFYTDGSGGLASAQQVQGKALSYNNINDTDAAIRIWAMHQLAPLLSTLIHVVWRGAQTCWRLTRGLLTAIVPLPLVALLR